MHTGSQLFGKDFGVIVDGSETDIFGLFPDWDVRDRFGIVLLNDYDMLGASLLTQAAIAAHFDCRPERRGPNPIYPEVFAFHIGKDHGDLNYYDFWPPRKEVIVPAGSPNTLLTEINARGITRLAVPHAELGDTAILSEGHSTWAEQYAARDRIVSAFAYSPSGTTPDSDIVIRALSPVLEQNYHATLNIEAATKAVIEESDDSVAYNEEIAASLPADVLAGIPADNQRMSVAVKARLGQVPDQTLLERRASRAEALAHNDGEIPDESYRRLTIDEALGILSSFV